MRVATDIGGTFTDLVYFNPSDPEAGFRVTKCDTTPASVERGVLNALAKERVSLSDVDFFAHGTTVVINTITERKGVKTGLITTRGFRDALELGRANRPDLYNLMYRKPRPFVRRQLRREISERMNWLGEVIQPVALAELEAIVADFLAAEVEAVAVCLLHSYANPAHERAVATEIRRLWPSANVSVSHDIIREWREYERTSTTVFSAMVQPIVDRYLDRLASSLEKKGFHGQLYIMRSNGGVDTAGSVRKRPITMLESGPASGVLGAAALGKIIGEENIIALDIGGTTAKCSLVDRGQVRITTKVMIERTSTWAGYPILSPSVDIVEIGNGGGSIARVDEFGKLRVGPESAGASPGPVAYGRGGTEPTTTDAHLMTGRIDPANFHGGEFEADLDKVRTAFDALGAKIGVSRDEAARGVIRIANNNMINALKLVSLNRGYDPRDFTLIAFGGGGGMHAGALARELGIRKVVVPVNSSVFSAWGMLLSDVRRDYVVTQLMQLAIESCDRLNKTLAEVAQLALADYQRDGFPSERVRLEASADLRYEGQEHAVKVDLPSHRLDPAGIETTSEQFHVNYEREYSYRLSRPIELVGIHLAAVGIIDKPALPRWRPSLSTRGSPRRRTRRVDFDVDGVQEAAVYDRHELDSGSEGHGPAILEEPDTVIIVWPGQRYAVDDYGNVHIEVR